MAAWYGDDFSIDVNLTGREAQQVAIYMADYDSWGREQKVEALDGETLLDSRTVSNFGGGTYLVWTIRGHVTIRVTRLSGPNAVVSGILIGPAPAAGGSAVSPSATFLKSDDTTQGDWKGLYGASGYSILADATRELVDASGGAGSMTVTAPAGCSWSAATDVSWMTVTSGASGSGPGTVGFDVSANATTSPALGYPDCRRTALPDHASSTGATAPCAYTLSATSQASAQPAAPAR